LKDIWFGRELLEMRESMQRFKIPVACHFCRVCYESQRFSNVNALAYDAMKPDANGYPAYMDFSLDNRCNLACIMCDPSLSSGVQQMRGLKRTEREFSYDQVFINQLEEFIPHLKGAVFTGGEPFLISTYYVLWEKMLLMNPSMSISVTSNGTLYNDAIAELLKRGKFSITLSIDSFHKDTYELIRKGAEFDSVMSNADMFAQHCREAGTYFGITVCPMQLNWKEIPKIVAGCNERQWHFTYNVVLKPWNLALWSLRSADLESIVDYLRRVTLTLDGTEISKRNTKRYHDLIELIAFWAERARIQEKNLDEHKTEALHKKAKDFLMDVINSEISARDQAQQLEERVLSIFDHMPASLLTDAFLDYLIHFDRKFLVREIRGNDPQTIAEHFTIAAFNLK
jgi:molybdenum cofactor biosynthesis enzyme MoaA